MKTKQRMLAQALFSPPAERPRRGLGIQQLESEEMAEPSESDYDIGLPSIPEESTLSESRLDSRNYETQMASLVTLTIYLVICYTGCLPQLVADLWVGFGICMLLYIGMYRHRDTEVERSNLQ